MRFASLVSIAVLGLGACATVPSTSVSPSVKAVGRSTSPFTRMPAGTTARAIAHLAGASGSLVSGTLTLMQTSNGVRIQGDLGGLLPGSTHGFHVHETGDCSAADASSAGGHFNPDGSPHGKAETARHHAGDIDNITVDPSGVAHVDAIVVGAVLGGAGSTNILGRALVVHAAPDDYRTQPSGNSGTRIACGVVRTP
jgi:Cu-Zn family superoxide dismutase